MCATFPPKALNIHSLPKTVRDIIKQGKLTNTYVGSQVKARSEFKEPQYLSNLSLGLLCLLALGPSYREEGGQIK